MGLISEIDIEVLMELVIKELDKATTKFPAFNSPHEGYAIIKEELNELWEEVKANRGTERVAVEEAIQVAAMAIRYVADLDKS